MPFVFVTQIDDTSDYEIGQSKLSVGKYTELLEKDKKAVKSLRYDIGSESASSVKQAEAFLHRELTESLVSSGGNKSKIYRLLERDIAAAVEKAREVLANHERVEALKDADVIEEMADPSDSDQRLYEDLLKVRERADSRWPGSFGPGSFRTQPICAESSETLQESLLLPRSSRIPTVFHWSIACHRMACELHVRV